MNGINVCVQSNAGSANKRQEGDSCSMMVFGKTGANLMDIRRTKSLSSSSQKAAIDHASDLAQEVDSSHPIPPVNTALLLTASSPSEFPAELKKKVLNKSVRQVGAKQLPAVAWSGASKRDRTDLKTEREFELCLSALRHCRSIEKFEAVLQGSRDAGGFELPSLQRLRGWKPQLAIDGLAAAAKVIVRLPNAEQRHRALACLFAQAENQPGEKDVLKAIARQISQWPNHMSTEEVQAVNALCRRVENKPHEAEVLVEYVCRTGRQPLEHTKRQTFETVRKQIAGKDGEKDVLVAMAPRLRASTPMSDERAQRDFNAVRAQIDNRPGEAEVLVALTSFHFHSKRIGQYAYNALSQQAQGKPFEAEVLLALIKNSLYKLPESEYAGGLPDSLEQDRRLGR